MNEESMLLSFFSVFICLCLSLSKCGYELREHEHERLCELDPHLILSLSHTKCMVNEINTKCGNATDAVIKTP